MAANRFSFTHNPFNFGHSLFEVRFDTDTSYQEQRRAAHAFQQTDLSTDARKLLLEHAQAKRDHAWENFTHLDEKRTDVMKFSGTMLTLLALAVRAFEVHVPAAVFFRFLPDLCDCFGCVTPSC